MIKHSKPTATVGLVSLETRQAMAPAAEYARIPAAVALYGISRSALYREAGQGRIILRKHGKATLVDLASLRAFLGGLPAATIRVPRKQVGG